MTDDVRHLGIVELGDVCARMAATSLDLFRELGAWVVSTPAGQAQRWYATACHRHAWHAELWAARSPSIPGVDLGAAIAASRVDRLPTTPDETAYRRRLDELMADLDAIADRVDGDLDPSTRRVVALVGNDVADLLTA